jgi:hypothetical protein
MRFRESREPTNLRSLALFRVLASRINQSDNEPEKNRVWRAYESRAEKDKNELKAIQASFGDLCARVAGDIAG